LAIYRNVTGNMIMINETGTEIPPDAEFDIEDHPELERSHQFKRLVSMNFIVKVPAKRNNDVGDPVKILQAGPIPIDVMRQLAAEMGAVFKEALAHQDVIDVDRLARQVGDHIMQNGVVADKRDVQVSNEGFEVEAARSKVMDSALRFQSVGDRPSVSVQEELDEGDDLGGAAKRLKRTLEGG
jgi:hypothetical protein